jgi:hypothetical protein
MNGNGPIAQNRLLRNLKPFNWWRQGRSTLFMRPILTPVEISDPPLCACKAIGDLSKGSSLSIAWSQALRTAFPDRGTALSRRPPRGADASREGHGSARSRR